jgi:hypothetical protein
LLYLVTVDENRTRSIDRSTFGVAVLDGTIDKSKIARIMAVVLTNLNLPSGFRMVQ